MKLGVDLRVFQIGHQYRGIGAHLYNLIREFSKLDSQPELVFYEYPNIESGLAILEDVLPKLKKYEVRKTRPRQIGKSFLQRELASFYERNVMGDAGIIDLEGVDKLLLIDFNLGVPRKSKIKSCLISYDMIPWILSEHYLPNAAIIYKKTHGPRRAIKAQLEKWLYFSKIKQANKRAAKILSISEHTKRDLVKYLKIKPRKITIVHLGTEASPSINKLNPKIRCITASKKKITLVTNGDQYVFFMGGADRRRRIEDLVKAFDSVASRNESIKLVLAGYDLQSIEKVPDLTTSKAIKKSKHKDRILFAGFVSQEQRNSLYKDSIAFIFPSTYEGFGLPLLEAMSMNCPSITYSNSSIKEVGGDAVLYADNHKDIAKNVEKLIAKRSLRSKLISKGKVQLKKFSWEKTAQETLGNIAAM